MLEREVTEPPLDDLLAMAEHEAGRPLTDRERADVQRRAPLILRRMARTQSST